MKKQKKGFLAALTTIMFVCAGVGLIGCAPILQKPNDSNSHESVSTELESSAPSIQVTLPTIADVSADVIEHPVGISMNGCDLLNVCVDGTELPDTHYVTRNGRFILAYETYGDELAVGNYEVKLTFAQGEVSYSLTIVDQAEPACLFDTKGGKTSYVKGDTLEIPVITRLNEYQEYDSVYTVYDSDGEAVQTYTNVESSTETIVWNSVDTYTLQVSLKRGDQTVKTFDSWQFEVQPFAGAAVFAEANIGAEGWVSGLTDNTTIHYNEEEKALQFSNKVANGMRSDQGVVSYPVTTLKKAKEAGYEALSFAVKPNETMAANPWWDLPTADNKVAWNSVSSAGLRIFGATKRVDLANKIRHDYVVWENDINYINRGNQGSGVYVYKDIYVEEMSVDSYTQVVIDVDEFLALGTDIEYMSFVIGGVKGSILSVGNTKWLTQEELTAYETAKIAADKTTYATKNYAAKNMLYRWGVHKNSAYLTRSYDSEVGALKAMVNTSGGHSKSQTNIFAMGALDLKYAYEKLGFTHITVKWKASKEMLNPSDATTGTGRCVRLYTSVLNTKPYGSEINVPDLGTTSTTFEISLEDLIGTKNANYLCFVIGGDVGDAVWFESVTLSVKE